MPDPAPSRLPAAPVSQSEIELPLDELSELAGDIVAGVCSLIVQGLGEFKRDAKMSADVKLQGGQLMAGLLELRQAYASVLDFDRLCYQAGTRTLRERNGSDVSDAMINALVAAAVDIMVRIARLRSN
jgi:hypothetical protein